MLITIDVIFRLLAVRDALQQQRRQRASEINATATNEQQLLETTCAMHDSDARVEDDYAGVIRQALGPRSELLALVSIVVSMFGSLVAYALYIAENLARFVSPYCHLPEWGWALLSVVPWLVLALADDVSFLAPFGAVGLACALGFSATLLYDTAAAVSWSSFTTWLRSLPVVEPNTLLVAISIAAFCNEGVVVMALNVQSEMANPRSFPSAVTVALSFFALCYLAVGVAGFALYRDKVTSPISDAFDTSTINIVAVALYAAQLLPTYSLINWLTYSIVEQYVLRWRRIPHGSAKHNALKWKAFVPARWAATLLSAALALTVHRVGDFLALIGASANALGIYLLPHAAWLATFAPALRDARLRTTPIVLRAAASVAVMVLGVGLAIGGTYTSVVQLAQ